MEREANGEGADGALRVPAFRAAFLLSAFGYEFLFFVMTLRVYDITGRALDVGIFTALTFLPKTAAPLYGALVDRVGARAVLARSAAAAAALAACLGLADGIASLYGLWLALSALFMLVGNARTVLVAEAAREGGRSRANSLALASLTAARLLAPLAAGLLARSVGAEALVLASAALYALCAAAAARSGGGPSAGRASGTGAPSAFREGFACLWRSTELRAMTLIGVLWRLFVGMQSSLLVVYISRTLGRSSADYGLAMALVAAGGLAGSLAGPYLLKILGTKLLAGAGLGVHFLCFAALGAIGDYPLALAALAFGHFGLYASVVAMHARRDAAALPAQRGRAYGANTAILAPAAIVSMVAGGALADRFGAAPVFAASGTAAAACLGAACAAWALRRGGGASARRIRPAGR